MAMSKKHYEAVAKILNEELNRSVHTDVIENIRSHTVERIVADLADYFESDNPLFVRERFEEACLK